MERTGFLRVCFLEAGKEVVAARAARAAVLKPDDAVGVLHREYLAVDVHLRHVIHDDAHLEPAAVPQNVLHHGRLARAEEATDDGDGYFVFGLQVLHRRRFVEGTPTKEFTIEALSTEIT